jgi:serine/threonine-protein kinase
VEAPPATERFLQLLEKSELLSPQQVAAAIERYELHAKPSAAEIAETLVSAGVLNRFQAERLLEGRSRGYFIGRYKLLEILGTGGMGWLYSAEDLDTGGKVALKVLSDRYKHDAGMLTRLKLEADVRLKHPNIVRTFKIDHTRDVHDIHYIIMEWVEGIGLQELLRMHGPLPWRQACDVIMQGAAGLDHVHRAGLVHRDVKPENFLIDHSGNVKVLDFGLSLMEAAPDDEFSLAMIFGHDCLGSADYMAPEQWLNSSAVDARADVYGLGCTLYVALTGAIPFPFDTVPKKAQAHRTKTAKPVQRYAPDIPEGVARIVERMMAKSADDRFQTAAEVCQALEPFAERKLVSFDFPAVLESRAADARRRLTAMREQREKLAAEKSRRAEDSGRPDRPGAANMETMVVGDTHPSQPAALRLDPFETLALDEPRSGGAYKFTPPAAAEPPPAAWLVPPDDQQRIPLTKNRILIGRHAACDVQLNSAQISGRHCELVYDGNNWRLRDLNSKNGVAINGTRAVEHLLWPGDRLTIGGQYEFRFELDAVDSDSKPRRRYLLIATLAAAALIATALLLGRFWQ